MEGKQFQNRTWLVILVLAVLLCVFTGVLYNLQVNNMDYYRGISTRKIANRETVEAARGEILDRYGRVLVSNRATYQVTLDTSPMGEEPERNANLLELLALCRENKVEWADTIPISSHAPFTYTSGEALSYTVENEDGSVSVYQTNFARLLEALPLKGLPEEPTAAEAMAALRAWFEVDQAVSDGEARALVGVLCELNLRSRDIVRSGEYIFAQDVGIDFISAVKEHKLVGVCIEATTVREYNTSCAAHLLGRVAPIYAEEWAEYKEKGYSMDDTVGKEGAELAFEEYLRGEAGSRTQELTTSHKVVSESWDIDLETGEVLEPKPGDNVMLTLDIKLQEALERSMAQRIPALPSEDTEGGAAVIIDMSGGVLAMASYPTFDLATYSYDSALADLAPLYNRATNGRYTPGSTFKMVVAAAALEEGVTTPTEKILDTGYFTLPEEEKYPYGDYHPQCWIYRQYRGSHGRVNVSDALRDSCNIYFYTMGHRLGIEKIDEYAAMFGLGEKTGFELPEYQGYVAGPETSQALGGTWYGGNLLSAAIGQGDTSCTPLQLANYIATLVNGGNHYSAHLLQTVKTSDYSSTVYQREPELLDTLGLKTENMEAIKLGMWKVANEGTASSYFKDLPVEVGAKTGTAQTGSTTTEADAVFVCFAPYEDPQIAMAIVVEKGGSGTELAAIAADVLAYYFNAEDTIESVSTENTLLR